MNIKKLKILLWVVWLSIAGPSQGAGVTGEVGFVGVGSTPLTLIGGTNFSNSTGIGFGGSWEIFGGGTGDYASVLPGWPVTFGSISFDPFPPIPQAPLWTFSYAGRTYSLDGLSSVNITNRTASEITLTGQGNLNITGLDTTPGQWNFTANTYGSVFTFSSGAVASPIAAPEIDASSGTSAIALLIGSLLILAERSRRSYQIAR